MLTSLTAASLGDVKIMDYILPTDRPWGTDRMQKSGYISVSEAADALGVSRNRVYQLVRSRLLATRPDRESADPVMAIKADDVARRIASAPRRGRPRKADVRQ